MVIPREPVDGYDCKNCGRDQLLHILKSDIACDNFEPCDLPTWPNRPLVIDHRS